MPLRLKKEEVVSLRVLKERGMKNTEIARTLGVTEGAVRYHARRAASNAVDGRAGKPRKAESFGPVIEAWVDHRSDGRRPINVRELHEHLVREHSYQDSYKSVLRFVRAQYGRPAIRTYRRVETPPGAQAQIDWGIFRGVRIGLEVLDLAAFVMVLSHSRKPAVVWSQRMDMVNWIHCHNEAYRRLGGVAAVNRIDNVKTAIVSGAGAWGVIHKTYLAYAIAVGFHVDACGPGEANAKGKVESKVRLGRLLLDPSHGHYDAIEHLQAASDRRIDHWSERAICPATGTRVQEAYEDERKHLAPLPILPEPFDTVVSRPVYRDCTVNFEGRQYTVPFALCEKFVEVRGCARTVQIFYNGRVVREYPRHSQERILIDPTCYDGPSTAEAIAPKPLGKMSRKLAEIVAIPVEKRPLNLYAALAEVAR